MIVSFLKFGKAADIEDSFDQNYLYFNTLKKYDFQDEYRILLKTKGMEPIKFRSPNMKQYSKVFSNIDVKEITIKLK